MRWRHCVRRVLAGTLVLTCAGAWLPLTAKADTFSDVNAGASYTQALADLVVQSYCNLLKTGHYYDVGQNQQIIHDVMTAALTSLGPLGTALEISRDSADFLTNKLIGQYLDAGETQLTNQLNDFDQRYGYSGLPMNHLSDFEQLVDSVDFTTDAGVAIADAALASYGSVVEGVPPDQINQYVATHRGLVNSNYHALQVGVEIMLLRHLQMTGNKTEWDNTSLSSYMISILGDKFGLVGLGDWILHQVWNAHCPSSTPSVAASLDPNSIGVQPSGAGGQGWVQATQTLHYVIHFENEPTATAAATNVRVTASLASGLDPATVQPGSSSFAGATFSFDPQSGQLVWTLPGIDLPADTNPPNGEGWVSFSAAPKSGQANGTAITESAAVYFDYNPPVQTGSVTVTIDASAPAVAVSPVTAGPTPGTLQLDWKGASQAGIGSYAVFESVDGGPLQLAVTTTQTSAALPDAAGHTYGFAVQATDVTGLSSATPAAAQVTYSVPSQAGASGTSGGGSGGGGNGTGPASSAPRSVGSPGGMLQSGDGSFSMALPPGEIGPGQSLSVATSVTAPGGAPGLPPGFHPAGPFITLSGPRLNRPAVATVKSGVAPGQTATVFADGAWHYRPTSAGPGGTLRVYVTGPETLVVLASTPRFPDVPAGYWAAGPIRTLVGAGIASGFPDGSFQPAATLTRAQFVKLLDLTLGLPVGPVGPASIPFSDVAPADWFAPYVAAAAKAGLVAGTTPDTFSPQAPVTREQLAVLLARALKLTGGTALTFTDAGRVDAWARAAVSAAVAAHLLTGFPDGTFQPLAPATRAQAAKVLAAAIARMAPPKLS